MDIIDSHRRKWLGLGMAAVGLGLLPSHAFASLATPRPKILRFNNLNTGETIKAEFFDGKRYNKHELAKLNHLLEIIVKTKSKPSIPHCLTKSIYCKSCLITISLLNLFLVIVH